MDLRLISSSEVTSLSLSVMMSSIPEWKEVDSNDDETWNELFHQFDTSPSHDPAAYGLPLPSFSILSSRAKLLVLPDWSDPARESSWPWPRLRGHGVPAYLYAGSAVSGKSGFHHQNITVFKNILKKCHYILYRYNFQSSEQKSIFDLYFSLRNE